MTVSTLLGFAVRLAVVLVVAVLAGVATKFAAAVVGHEILVMRYGADLAPIDDSPPMIAAVWTAYLAGLATGLIVLAVGCWRFVLRPRAPGAHPDDARRDPAQ